MKNCVVSRNASNCLGLSSSFSQYSIKPRGRGWLSWWDGQLRPFLSQPVRFFVARDALVAWHLVDSHVVDRRYRLEVKEGLL